MGGGSKLGSQFLILSSRKSAVLFTVVLLVSVHVVSKVTKLLYNDSLRNKLNSNGLKCLHHFFF